MAYWAWERADWGAWEPTPLVYGASLEQSVRAVARIGALSARLSEQDHLASEAALLEKESLQTSLIEGHLLNRDSIRSSIARKLGILPLAQPPTREVDGLVDMLLDATRRYDQPLTHERLCRWQAGLFPSGRDEHGFPIEVGAYRSSPAPMKVISMKGRREIVHYIAPPSSQLEAEMARFVEWFNNSGQMPSYLRAAIASYWFVSIHPFEDGNGRLCRAIADMAIAQAEQSPYRLYSFSETLKAQKNSLDQYYQRLEACQRNDLSIDQWLAFFLETLTESAYRAEQLLEGILKKTAFWDACRDVSLNERQRKFLNWVLDQGSEFEGHIKRRRYGKINRDISDATIKRDLLDMVKKQILLPIETVGRNAGYRINPGKLEKKG